MGFFFPEYHSPNESEFEALFDRGIVSVDANVLLNLYEYTDATRQKVLEVLEHFSAKGQLWLAHQAAGEYHRNRPGRILSQLAEFGDLKKVLEEQQSAVTEALQPHMRYEHTGVEAILRGVVDAYAKATADLTRTQEAAPRWMDDDAVLAALEAMIGDRVTPVWESAEVEEATVEAKRRMELELPPGFKDKAKAEPARYGDYFIWRQLVELADAKGLPLLFVTDDDKDDWWWRVKGRTIGPRPELICEFRDRIGQPFHMYGTTRFVEWALQRLKLPEDSATIAELAEVERASDKRHRYQLDAVLRLECEAALEAAMTTFTAVQDRKYALDQRGHDLEAQALRVSQELVVIPPGDDRAAAMAELRALEAARLEVSEKISRLNREAMEARRDVEVARLRADESRMRPREALGQGHWSANSWGPA